MSHKLSGSSLTHNMLEHGHEKLWCAVSNDGDKQAMTAISSPEHSFLKCIILSDNSRFLCKDGTAWQYAVPVERIKMTQKEVGFKSS